MEPQDEELASPMGYAPPFWSRALHGEPHGVWDDDIEDDDPAFRETMLRVNELEATLREAVERARGRGQAAKLQNAQSLLVKALERGDAGTLGAKKKKNGRVDQKSFVRIVEKRFGVAISEEEARAMFAKCGHDVHYCMPYDVFARRLFASESHLLGLMGFRNGAMRTDEPASLDFRGAIRYRPCKSGCFAPTNWNPRLGYRSAAKPESYLKLEFVYGFGGLYSTQPCLFYTASAEVVYFNAAVAVVYDKESHTQRFFQGHDDDIVSLAMHPDHETVATGQLGKFPKVLIWSATTTKEVARIEFSSGGDRSIQCLSFSSDGKRLVTVSTDNAHTVRVWDWSRGKCVATGTGMQGTPPQVYGAVFNPFQQDSFCTYGHKHVKFWSLKPVAGKPGKSAYEDVQGKFGKDNAPEPVLSAAWLPGDEPTLVTGTASGKILVWRHGFCVAVVKAHSRDVKVLCLRTDGQTLLSGGGDGKVIEWDVSEVASAVGEAVGAALKQQNVTQLAGKRTGIIGLDDTDDPASDVFIAGTDGNDIIEVDAYPSTLIEGHHADLYGVAPHPLNPSIFATACEDSFVYIWDAKQRKCTASFSIDAPAQAVAFSPDGDMLAVSTTDGAVCVLDTAGLADGALDAADKLAEMSDCEEAIDDLKFSPDGRFLAVGSHDNFIDIYDCANGFRRKGRRCKGHSSYVTHLDWSADSSLIQSNCGAYDVLYWDSSGRRVTASQRDTEWDTWTCVLGFPVMGIWPDGTDGTDINSVARSNNGKYMATADDGGKVKLFNYPVVIDDAPHRSFKAHSSHVMNVRFSSDDKVVMSVGGKDRALMQWKTHGVAKPSSKFAGREGGERAAAEPPKPRGKAEAARKAAVKAKPSVVKQAERVEALEQVVGDLKAGLAAKDDEIAELRAMLAAKRRD